MEQGPLLYNSPVSSCGRMSASRMLSTLGYSSLPIGRNTGGGSYKNFVLNISRGSSIQVVSGSNPSSLPSGASMFNSNRHDDPRQKSRPYPTIRRDSDQKRATDVRELAGQSRGYSSLNESSAYYRKYEAKQGGTRNYSIIPAAFQDTFIYEASVASKSDIFPSTASTSSAASEATTTTTITDQSSVVSADTSTTDLSETETFTTDTSSIPTIRPPIYLPADSPTSAMKIIPSGRPGSPRLPPSTATAAPPPIVLSSSHRSTLDSPPHPVSSSSLHDRVLVENLPASRESPSRIELLRDRQSPAPLSGRPFPSTERPPSSRRDSGDTVLGGLSTSPTERRSSPLAERAAGVRRDSFEHAMQGQTSTPYSDRRPPPAVERPLGGRRDSFEPVMLSQTSAAYSGRPSPPAVERCVGGRRDSSEPVVLGQTSVPFPDRRPPPVTERPAVGRRDASEPAFSGATNVRPPDRRVSPVADRPLIGRRESTGPAATRHPAFGSGDPIHITEAQGARNVRWNETLICPSPILQSQRRKGWFNRRGDQLWTNDGEYKPADPGCGFPREFADYPDVGQGWQNEEGIRIDMQHRLVPKPPLRSALKPQRAPAVSSGGIRFVEEGPPR